MGTVMETPIKIYLDANFAHASHMHHKPSYVLAHEWATPINPEDVNGALSDVFSSLNMGSPFVREAEEYRSNGHRSLSVGDVVVIGETAFRCDPTGWSVLDPQEILANCP